MKKYAVALTDILSHHGFIHFIEADNSTDAFCAAALDAAIDPEDIKRMREYLAAQPDDGPEGSQPVLWKGISMGLVAAVIPDKFIKSEVTPR